MVLIKVKYVDERKIKKAIPNPDNKMARDIIWGILTQMSRLNVHSVHYWLFSHENYGNTNYDFMQKILRAKSELEKMIFSEFLARHVREA